MTKTERDFREWVRGKTGPYNYCDIRHCAFSQFLRERYKMWGVTTGGFRGSGFRWWVIPVSYAIPEVLYYALIAPSFEQLRENMRMARKPA